MLVRRVNITRKNTCRDRAQLRNLGNRICATQASTKSVSVARLLALSRRGDAWQLAPESSQSWPEKNWWKSISIVRCMYDFRQNSQTRSPMLVNSKIQLSWMMMYKRKIYTFYCELIILTFPKCHTTLRQALAICLPPRIVLSINWGGQLRTACVATALEQLHVSSWSKHFLGRRTQIWVCVLYNHIFVHLWFAMFSFPSIIYIPSPP